jgi:RNA-directed DNA polymerase
LLPVLQPVWDGTFSQGRYGFRPGRSAHQAIAQAQKHLDAGYRWVVDLARAKFCDRVNQDKVMSRVTERDAYVSYAEATSVFKELDS